MHNAEILGAIHRQERVTSDKTRSSVVDVEGIKEQAEEKRKQEEEDKKQQDAYAATMLHNSRVASILQRREEKEKRAMEEAVVSYRHQHQQPWHQREYDLNDPQRCRRADPADGHMVLPGLAGEDPDGKGRVQRQREQLREWLVQQQSERAAGRRRLQLEEQGYNQSTEDTNHEAVRLERLEMEERKAAAMNTHEYNKAKAKTEEMRRREQDRIDEARQADAMKQLLAGAAVTAPVPGLCPSSDRRDPPESLQQVLQYQQCQIEEKRRIEWVKKQEEDQQERARLDSARAALLIERQQAKLNKQLRKHLDSTNVKLAEIHKQCKPDIERGHIDDSFFSKFNTSRR